MSHNDLLGTTSRSALIHGMTNTDQVGMQQGRAPQRQSMGAIEAEVLPDAGDGADNDGGGEGDVNPETGLTPEQEAEFEAMRTGEAPPAGDDPGDDTDGETDDDGGDPDGDGEPAAGDRAPTPLGREKTPAELAAEAAKGQRPAPKTINVNKHNRLLKQAQTEAQQARDEARKAREDAIKLGERVAMINEALSTPQPPPVDPNAPPANPFDEDDVDPTVDYAAAVQQLQRRQRFQREESTTIANDVVESNEDRNMRDTFTRDFQSYAARDPNMPAAYQFLKDSRLTEICISEFDKDPNDPDEMFTAAEVEKMVQIFNAEEKWVVGNALKQRKSPAMAIMKLARSRGFKPAAAAPPAPAARAPAAPAARAPQLPVRTNGAARPPVATAAPDAAAMLADLAAAQEGGRSLSDGGGAPPSGLSAEILLRMDDDEFAEMIDSLPQHQLNALLGK